MPTTVCEVRLSSKSPRTTGYSLRHFSIKSESKRNSTNKTGLCAVSLQFSGVVVTRIVAIFILQASARAKHAHSANHHSKIDYLQKSSA